MNVRKALFVLVVAWGVWFLFLRSSKDPWHQGPKWEALLRLYDKMAKDQFDGCESKYLDTRFGSTHVFACGSASKPTVLFLHGAGSNSLIYGDWLMPLVRDSHYAVAIDYPCDVGRSSPPEGDTSKCPQTQEEMSEWIQQILSHLHPTATQQQRKVALVGYSYGSFIAASVALVTPAVVDRTVLIAPAAIVAPVEAGWIMRALVYGMIYPGNWFFKYMSADPEFDVKNMKEDDRLLTYAIRDLMGATVLAVHAAEFSHDQLRKIAQEHPTLLIIGEQETVVNSTLAIQNAKNAGMQVETWPNSGHLLLMEYPRKSVAISIAKFLQE